MRTLSLLLILANVLFFIWAQLVDVQVSPLDRARSRSAERPPRIVLAREATNDAAQEESPAEIRDVAPPSVVPLDEQATQAQVARADAPSCTSVGPFPDLPQAAQAQSALRAAGYEPRQRVEQGELWAGYWVSVPDLPTRAVAEQVIQQLNDQGVTDVYLMPGSGSESTHVISLGVFSDYQRAQRRANQASAIGVEPRISDRRRAGSVYWLDVDLREPGETLDASVFQTGEARILRLEMRPCPPPPEGG